MKKYDLQERTLKFSKNIILFLKTLPDNQINRPLVNQIIRSATSVGANYREADGAESKKDFKHKISICKKEAKETAYWLQVIAQANPGRQNDCRELWEEAHQLTLIFSSIFIK